jgi:hypothetical protein
VAAQSASWCNSEGDTRCKEEHARIHAPVRICLALPRQSNPLPWTFWGALQMSHTDEKKKQAQSYRKQLKDLEEQLVRMRKESHAKARLETLMRKSEDAMLRLKNDISRIRNQKSGLLKQVRVFEQRLRFCYHLAPESCARRPEGHRVPPWPPRAVSSTARRHQRGRRVDDAHRACTASQMMSTGCTNAAPCQASQT